MTPRRSWRWLMLVAIVSFPTVAYGLFDPSGPAILAEIVAQSETVRRSVETANNIRSAVYETAEVAQRSLEAMRRTVGFVQHPELFLAESAQVWQEAFPDLEEIKRILRDRAILEGREALGAALNSPSSRFWQEQFGSMASEGEKDLQRGLARVVDALDYADPHKRANDFLKGLRDQAATALHDLSQRFAEHTMPPEEAGYVAARAAAMQADMQGRVAEAVTRLAQHVDVSFGNAMAATSESLAVQKTVHEQLKQASAAWQARPFVAPAQPNASRVERF